MDFHLADEKIPMEPITATAIIAALATGAASAAGKTAISDAYESLKGLIKNKIAENNGVNEAVSQLEKKPDSEGRQLFLREEIQSVNADQDDEIHAAAIMLIEEIKSLPNGEKTISQIAIGNNIAQANGNSVATVTINTTKNQ
jgi:hypothetical protein